MVRAPIEIQTSQSEGVYRLAVVGELDLATGPVLSRRVADLVADGAAGAIEIDLGGVTFIDARGLGALLEAQKRHNRPGSEGLILVNGSRTVRRLFELVGVSDRLAPEGSQEGSEP